MDLRTGKTYATKDEALADGVPESDVVEVKTTRDKDFILKFANRKYPEPHQGKREIQRRSRRLAKRGA